MAKCPDWCEGDRHPWDIFNHPEPWPEPAPEPEQPQDN